MKRSVLLFSLLLALSLQTPKEVLARPQAQITSAGQLIDAVNGLRISYGLAPLPSHPLLMQSAQSQADYMAATGQITHARPGGGTFTQQLISLGFPLAGDLSLGGLRAENILMSNGPLEWNGVPPAWQDEQHMNTMLSQNYTHIGAGVSQSGDTYYYAVDTASATGNGQQQESASSILTSVPAGASEAGGVSQYMVPVSISTAGPDGNVFHKVQYGQSLWSIAIAYGTTIKNIQALNNLGENSVVYQGQELLVLMGATPPPLDPATMVALSTITMTPTQLATPQPLAIPTTGMLYPTITTTPEQPERPKEKSNFSGLLFSILIIALCVAGAMAVWLIRDPDK